MEQFFGGIVYNFVVFFSNFTKTLIPLSFTIFFFAYRELKDVAYSLFKNRKAATSSYIFLILTLLLLITNIYIEPIEDNLLDWQNVLCFVIDISWVFSAGISYKKILGRINIHNTFDNTLKLLDNSFKKIRLLKEGYNSNSISDFDLVKKTKNEVNEVTVSAEIIFQIMLTKKKYNLKGEFSDSLKKLNQNIFKELSEINNDPNYFSFIVPYSGTGYSHLYSTTLQGIVDLLEEALEMNNPKDIKLLIDSFNDIHPYIFSTNIDMHRLWKSNVTTEDILEKHFKKMYDEYYFSSFRIVNQLYKSNNNLATLILRNLVKYDQQTDMYSTGNDILTLIASLIINAIEHGDIKQLTDVVNVLLDYYVDRKEKNELPRKSNINTSIIEKKVMDTSSFISLEYKIYNFVFLSIVKAIELGKYNCAGFLIKVSVKNFNPKSYNFSIMSILKSVYETKPDLQLSKNLSGILPLNYTFSTASYEYCLMKAITLVYYQKVYTTEYEKVNVTNNDEYLDMKRVFKEKEHFLYYINKKICGLNNEYGLIYLKEKTFKSVRIDELYKAD